jgi:hypothetical protein
LKALSPRRLVSQWETIKLFYKLIKLPESVNDLHVSGAIKEEAERQIQPVKANPGRSPERGAGLRFREYLARYEMRSLLGNRDLFFKIP